MQKKQTKILMIGLMSLLLVFLAACGGSAEPAPPQEESAPAATNVPEEPVASESDSNQTDTTTDEESASSDDAETAEMPVENGQILAWVAPGLAPGRHTASGDIVLFDEEGAIEALMALPDGISRVSACGPEATSPDQSTFAFMTVQTTGGRDRAALHLMRGSDDPIQTIAEDLNPTSCVSSSSFEFSPDSSHFAYIDWPVEASNATSPRGRLLIYATEDGSEIANFENVSDFELTTGGAVFVSFFTNEDGEATEAGVFVWDGSNDDELSTLRADEDCYYPSAAITPVGEEQVALMLGYRCAGTSGTQWQLHTIRRDNGTTKLEVSSESGGRYFGFTDTNAVFASSDAQTIWFTVPDGVSNQTTSLRNTAVAAIDVQTILDRFVVMPSVSDLPYDNSNATAVFSSDGAYWAAVVNDGDNNAMLHVFDLAKPGQTPITFDAGERGDTIADLIFNADATILYFVAGADGGGDNSLFALDLATGNEDRISRGRFAQAALAPDSSALAIMNWVQFDEEEDPYLSLERVDLASGDATLLYEGGEVIEGKAANLSFAYPLTWRLR